MMFSSLRAKLLAGFGLVITVATVMAGVGLTSLGTLGTAASHIATESIPTSINSSGMKEQILLAGAELQAYADTRKTDHYEAALGYVDGARSYLAELGTLAAETNDEELASSVQIAGANIDSIEEAAKRVSELTASMREARSQMDAAAGVLVEKTGFMANLQNETLAEKIESGAPAEELNRVRSLLDDSADLVAAVSVIRVANFKGQADGDSSQISGALSEFDVIEENCVEILELTQLEAVQLAVAEVRQSADAYREAIESMLGAWNTLEESTRALLEQTRAVADTASEQVKAVNDEMQQSATANVATADFANTKLIAISLGALIVSAVIALMLAKIICSGIALIAGRVREIADGALRGEPLTRNAKDEIGQLVRDVRTMPASLREIIENLTEASSTVTTGAGEINARMGDLAGIIRQQAEGSQQVSAAITQMSESVREVSSGAEEASKMASGSGDLAKEGGDTVQSTIGSMRNIDEAVTLVSQSIDELGARGDQISEIVTVINDIADQTNLLALNAAIEAARAGEHGRGFAGVADEVRKLADRTTGATGEISQSIEDIRRTTGDAIERMTESKSIVVGGVEQAEQSGTKLGEIVSSAGTTAQRITSIAAAAEQQSAASNEISSAIEQSATLSDRSTESVDGEVSAATQLTGRADDLRSIVERFQLN